ncbi:helix-turn-helix domain-containing protein [Flexivirga alba]|uniref:Helix-turn-helix domain-containing protein n=1 Tax=Flexivirga alba TaxID=702742 RepID=A0ABW2AKS9_9MICO
MSIPVPLRGRLTVTVPEAAKVLGIGRDNAYRAAADGTLPTLKIGHRLIVPVPKLLEMLGIHASDDPTAQTAPLRLVGRDDPGAA